MNGYRGDAEVTLGDTAYTLRPTFEALQEIERLTGLGLIPLARRFHSLEFGVGDVKNVLVPAIKAGGGKVPDNIGKLIIEAGIMNLGGVVATFLVSALAGGEEKKADAPAE
ncbi:Phage tail tube protein, GTA-gp10 [uncultured Caudovirales phage]|uniref:Phage tail tube protein, GTA-gp10 n=1 Tax=uncultured Caudovirales phage TaxID=2100421 RepID=A0A6J5T727_9CAUD|nr:Phage tail tube protein, GTA-gp10 [uncultured Caudovirales phage]CAB4210835.1 Phage tail tube protein, GTA-gp10 [uncultured Caudovirales phage]CAB4223338.1 Phage tail tube protein, GTA-gp10 [uncultured Caudovirales phage]